ncbi:MAG: acyl-CoA dehydrogenase family protein [Myxococcales bacterium]|nr:acyl-CoA dehydrogenase family protein [Myxococcales bacterium]
MKFSFSREEEAFRAEVVEFLADYRDLDAFFLQGHKWDRVHALFRAMGAKGWLSLGWPKEAGGSGAPLSYEYILWDEVAYARAARNPLASGIVAKTIARYGTGEQQKQWLPPIRSGDLHFSLGYSEPEAGSDLASVRCRAERSGDRYVIHGQKCWQSYAQDMDYLWLLVRTGTQESRGRGLSLMIVDLEASGVTVRPLPTMDGDQLNEIHLDGVEIPVSQRVGPEDGAWKIMGEALADERHIQFPPKRLRRDLEEVVDWVKQNGLDGDPRVRHRLAELAAEVHQADALGLSVLDVMQRGRPGIAEAAANKVFQSIACQNIARAVMDFGGPEALVAGGRVELLYRQSMWETIGGGTSEIMRSVVAKQALGLAGRT